MELVHKKITASEKLIQKFNEYFEKLSPLLTEYEQENTTIKNILSKIPSDKQNLEKITNNTIQVIEKQPAYEKLVEVLFKFYHVCKLYDDNINLLYDTFNKSHLSADSIEGDMLSKTYKLETAEYFNNLHIGYIAYKTKQDNQEAELIQYMSNLLKRSLKQEKRTGDSLYNTVLYIRSRFHEYKNTVSLYAKFIQDLIDDIYISDKTNFRKILNIIEEDKTSFLSGQLPNRLPKKKNIHLINPPYQRFGLIPNTKSMPLAKLVETCFKKQVKGKISLLNYAKKHNVCFIIMFHVSYTGVEYNISSLINSDLAQDAQDKSLGINKKTISRFNNIKSLGKSKWKYKYQIIGDHVKSKSAYVFETLDGKNYRCLVPWNAHDQFLIPIYKLTSMLNFITQKVHARRSDNYHKLLCDDAKKNMFLPRNLSLDILEKYSQEIDSQSMRTDLFLKISRVMNDYIDKKYKKGIKNNIEVNDIIHQVKIRNVFRDTILALYKLGMQKISSGEFSAGKFPSSELLISYLYDLEKQTNRFMKALHNGYNRAPIDEDQINTVVIKKHLNDLLEKIINQQISNSDNIYIMLNFKYLILNFR